MKSILAIGAVASFLYYSPVCLGNDHTMLSTEDSIKSSKAGPNSSKEVPNSSKEILNSSKETAKNSVNPIARSENLELVISPEMISQRVKQIAAQIDKEYRGEEITMIMVMKGAVCIASDLMRSLNSPTQLEYIKASSYGMNGAKQGKLNLIGIENLDLKGKNILIVDDIFDSGKTMNAIVEQLRARQPKSLKTVVAFMKKVKREIAYKPDYVLFEVEDNFLVGYGLDYKEHYRALPGVYLVKNAE